MTDFTGFNLPPALAQSLVRMKYSTPTPIQAQAIPPALSGRDILGSAQTGTGKTAAFGIPLVARLLSNPRGSALVMTPTRELATQVMDVLRDLLGQYTTIQTALLIGGDSMPAQNAQLRKRPRLIVGTPGRINDHLERGSLMLHDTSFLVLDETDRMLDMGFVPQIDKIVRFLAKGRQTLLFSATLPPNILKLSEKYLNNPERVAVGSTTKPIANIEQEIIHVEQEQKFDTLLKQLDQREGSVIVFMKTKYSTERLAQKLNRARFTADAIHGDLQQRKRERVIDAFREKRFRILVATDIAARGLDISHIEHVINYDLPQCPEDYIHRIGRTARAGAEGAAVCFVSREDMKKWRAIQMLMNPEEARKQQAQHGQRHGNGNPNGNGNGKSRRRRPFRSFKPRGNNSGPRNPRPQAA